MAATISAESEWILRLSAGEPEQALRDDLDARLDGDAAPQPGDFDYDLTALYELDIGVAAAAIAVSAAGDVPPYSYNGQPGHAEDHHLVLLRCDRPHAEALARIPQIPRCGLVNAPNGRLLLYCGEAARLTHFAQRMLQSRAA